MILGGGLMGGDERGHGAGVIRPLRRKSGSKEGGSGRAEYIAT